MARSWRLRHKLGLGLALVVASVALLLGGAWFGLSSYVDSVRLTQRKLDEMQMVIQIRDHIHRMESAVITASDTGAQAGIDRERDFILESANSGRMTLQVYRKVIEADLASGEYFGDARDELAQIERLDQAFLHLEESVNRAAGAGVETVPGRRMIDNIEVAKCYEELNRLSTDLFLYLVADVQRTFDRSTANHRRSLSIAGFAAILAIVLVLTLLYYFRVWVFNPIRAIQAGVQRVHNGIFEQPIRLNSGDELQELGDEFNAMSVRIREVYADLARQVNERTRQLVRSERMVSVGFLAAGVAHEINNPLASIAFCAEALERRLQEIMANQHGPTAQNGRAQTDSEVIQKYIKMLQQEAFRCKEITQKLLDFSRSGGKKEPVPLCQLIEDVLEMAQHLPNARGKRILFHPAAEPTATVCAPDIKSVVLNLVVNSLDSMDEAGVLTVTLSSRGDFAEMAFQDTGCGMTQETLEHLFEPFFTRNRTGNGTGLGLSISHQIIDQHGGSIMASSEGLGKGSQFVVRVPLLAVETAGKTPEMPRPAYPFPVSRSAA